jgi:hypothetical protein
MRLLYLYYRLMNKWRRHRELLGPYDSIYGLNYQWLRERDPYRLELEVERKPPTFNRSLEEESERNADRARRLRQQNKSEPLRWNDDDWRAGVRK